MVVDRLYMASQEEPPGATIAKVGCAEAQPDISWIHIARITFRGSPPGKTLETVPRPSVYARTFEKAAALGSEPPPEAVFLTAVDLVLNDQNST